MAQGSNTHIKVRVFPDSAKEVIMKAEGNSFRVFLREPAKAGMANRRLLEVLSDAIEPKPKRIRIVTGQHSPSKIIEIEY